MVATGADDRPRHTHPGHRPGIGLGDIEVTHDQLENRTRIFFVDAAPEVDRYARDFELLTQIALPQDESAEFIHTIANQLRNNTTSGAL